MQLNPTAAALTPTAYARVDASEASKSAASVREQARASELVQAVRTSSVQGAVSHMMDGLSTVALVSASQSIPAALGRMRDIVATANSGTLSDADRSTLQAEYAQLSQQVATVIGSPPPNEGARSSTDKRDDGAGARNSADADAALADTGRQATQAANEPGRAKPAQAPRSSSPHDVRSGFTAPRTTRTASAVAQFQQHAAAPQTHISLVA